MKYQENKYIAIPLLIIILLGILYIFIAEIEFADYYFVENFVQFFRRSNTIPQDKWTIANKSYGPKYITYYFFNYTDHHMNFVIPNIVHKERFHNEAVETNKKPFYSKELMFFSDFYSTRTFSFYRLAPSERILCTIKYYDEKCSREYLQEITYSECFWDRGVISNVVFLYDGQDLYITTYDSLSMYSDSFLINGKKFSIKDYELYNWFYPDTTIKEYLNLPESIRCFSQEENENAVFVTNDLRTEYYVAQTIKERKMIRKKIAEKLKQEYPIR